MNMEINLTESLCGFRRLIKLLDNHQILINHPPGEPIKPNTSRSIKGYGMPNRHTHSHGDLIIHFDVEFPPKHFINTEKQRKVCSIPISFHFIYISYPCLIAIRSHSSTEIRYSTGKSRSS